MSFSEWVDFGPLVQESKPSMGHDSCRHLSSVPLQKQRRSGRHCNNRG